MLNKQNKYDIYNGWVYFSVSFNVLHFHFMSSFKHFIFDTMNLYYILAC